jgi:hypothetical protein
MAAVAPKQGGVVSLIEFTDDDQPRVIGNRAWTGSPMFVILEYFGLPFTANAYSRVLRSVREDDRGDLFIRTEDDHIDGEPIKAAIVQTVGDWGMEEAERFLAAHKH